jgi:hypothetical protein
MGYGSTNQTTPAAFAVNGLYRGSFLNDTVFTQDLGQPDPLYTSDKVYKYTVETVNGEDQGTFTLYKPSGKFLGEWLEQNVIKKDSDDAYTAAAIYTFDLTGGSDKPIIYQPASSYAKGIDLNGLGMKDANNNDKTYTINSIYDLSSGIPTELGSSTADTYYSGKYIKSLTLALGTPFTYPDNAIIEIDTDFKYSLHYSNVNVLGGLTVTEVPGSTYEFTDTTIYTFDSTGARSKYVIPNSKELITASNLDTAVQNNGSPYTSNALYTVTDGVAAKLTDGYYTAEYLNNKLGSNSYTSGTVHQVTGGVPSPFSTNTLYLGSHLNDSDGQTLKINTSTNVTPVSGEGTLTYGQKTDFTSDIVYEFDSDGKYSAYSPDVNNTYLLGSVLKSLGIVGLVNGNYLDDGFYMFNQGTIQNYGTGYQTGRYLKTLKIKKSSAANDFVDYDDNAIVLFSNDGTTHYYPTDYAPTTGYALGSILANLPVFDGATTNGGNKSYTSGAIYQVSNGVSSIFTQSPSITGGDINNKVGGTRTTDAIYVFDTNSVPQIYVPATGTGYEIGSVLKTITGGSEDDGAIFQVVNGVATAIAPTTEYALGSTLNGYLPVAAGATPNYTPLAIYKITNGVPSTLPNDKYLGSTLLAHTTNDAVTLKALDNTDTTIERDIAQAAIYITASGVPTLFTGIIDGVKLISLNYRNSSGDYDSDKFYKILVEDSAKPEEQALETVGTTAVLNTYRKIFDSEGNLSGLSDVEANIRNAVASGSLARLAKRVVMIGAAVGAAVAVGSDERVQKKIRKRIFGFGKKKTEE